MKAIYAENKKKSLLITAALYAAVILLLFYIRFQDTQVLMDLEGGGGGGDVAVNFGDSDFGQGFDFESLEPAATTVSAPVESAEQEIVVSDDISSPATVVSSPKKTETPKKVETPKKEVVTKPQPSKATNDALSNLLGNSGGDGNDGRSGNKGSLSGNAYDRGYDGGGGSGTGSGGGNGSGQGIGTGSGYGSGSGSGRGSGHGNYQLDGRKFLSKPAPKYTCNEQGRVAVRIIVDKSGKVIEAEPGVRGTTNTAKCLLDQAKIAALGTKINSSADAPDRQEGKIIYDFKLTE